MAKDNSNRTPADDGWETLAAPAVADGVVKLNRSGIAIKGVILERNVGEYGPNYLIKLADEIEGQDFDKRPTVFKAGQIVMVSELSGMRPLAERIKKGPTFVLITVLGKEGNRYLLDVKCKPAF